MRLALLVPLLGTLACGQAAPEHDHGPPGVVQNFSAQQVPPGDLEGVPLLLLLQEIGSRGFSLARANHLIARWGPPTTGLPAVYYVVEYEAAGQNQTSRASIQYIVGENADISLLASMHSIRGRVAGVDQLGRTGDWTPWTDWYPLGQE
jgi:hypothetical protein